MYLKDNTSKLCVSLAKCSVIYDLNYTHFLSTCLFFNSGNDSKKNPKVSSATKL